MTLSSGASRKESAAPLVPIHLPTTSGFGQGFNFHYQGKTSQDDWARQKYSGHYNQTGANDSKPEPHTQRLPDLVAANTAQDETSLNPYERLAFSTEVSIRYHSRRHEHYERVFRLMMMSIVFLASFAFVSGINYRVVLGLSIIGLALGTFVWNITNMSRMHDVLNAKYQALLDHIKSNNEPTENDIRHWRNTRLRLQTKEPAMFWAVANDCYYEVARAWELEPKQRGMLPWMLRPFMNWLRF